MADIICGAGGSNGQEIVDAINANTAAALANELAIGKLLASQAYYKDSNSNLLDLPETYTIIAELHEVVSAGEYEVVISYTTEFDTLNKAIFTDFSIQGGVLEEFRVESTDINDIEPYGYVFPFTMAVAGSFDLVLRMRKEDGTGILNCNFANATLKKVAELIPP